jgi:hypothetical protein
MCAHSQREAVARGYCAMQFNLVVSTNEAAVNLWQKTASALWSSASISPDTLDLGCLRNAQETETC